MLNRSSTVNRMSFFSRFEKPKMSLFSIYYDASTEPVFIEINTFHFCGAVFVKFHIPLIFCACCDAEIGAAIIQTVPINVVRAFFSLAS